MSQVKLGKGVNSSTAMISAIERGTRAPKRETAEALDTALSTGGTFTRLWIDLAAQQDVPEWFIDALHLEREAVEIREYQMTLVPGLLQTPEYARSMMSHGRPWDDPAAIDRLVDTRVRRLGKLGGNPLLWYVLDECAIRRVVGDHAVMRDQLGKLVDLAQSGTIRLQVIPQHTPHHPGMSGALRLMSFNDRQPIAFLEHLMGEVAVHNPEPVRQCMTVFGALQSEALPQSASLAAIQDIERELS